MTMPSRARPSPRRAALRGPDGAAIVDRLTRVALDARRHGELRLSSILALSDLEDGALEPLWKALAVSTPSRTTPR
jgi:hypothetical protein